MRYSKTNKLAFLFITTLLLANGANANNSRLIDKLESKIKGESLDYSKKSDKPIKRRSGAHLRQVQNAFKKSDSTDNVLEVVWDSEQTFKIRTRLRMATIIHLPKDEKIAAYRLGDDSFFSVKTYGESFPYMLDIQASKSGIDTSLMVLGKSGRIYNFYVLADPIRSKHLPDLTVYVKAPALDPDMGAQFIDKLKKNGKKKSHRDVLLDKITKDNDYLRSLPDPDSINLEYKTYGDREIVPYVVYDDGKWTYFDFRREGFVNDMLPVIYKVVDGYDMVINTRIKDGIMIAESLSPEGWTLKSGEKSVCVRPKISLFKIYSWFKKGK